MNGLCLLMFHMDVIAALLYLDISEEVWAALHLPA